MPLKYQQHSRLSHAKSHCDGVTSVAFSPTGLLLASGSIDGRVCVWDVASSKLLYVFSGKSAVLSLLWIPPNDGHIVCGMEDGTIASCVMSQDSIRITGFWAHHRPVEALSYSGSHLASGAQEELFVWSRSAETWVLVVDIGLPPRTSHSLAHEIIVTSLHWTTSRRRPVVLVATYMNHGILVIDGQTWKRVRCISFPGTIADADLTADGKYLAVSNMLTGFEVFSVKALAELEPAFSLRQDVSAGSVVPIRFVHGGNALIGGTSTGRMHIWDMHTRRKQVLHFNSHTFVPAISALYNKHNDTFIIATGVFKRGGPSPVIIWKAQELDVRRGPSSITTEKHPIKNFVSRAVTYCLTSLFLMLCYTYLVELYDVASH